MPRPSPFADLDATEKPAADAVIVELGRPTRAAFGCFGLTTLFLAVIALAAVGYAVAGPPSSNTALRWVAAVLGGVFVLLVGVLVVVAVRANRIRQGLAVDADAVWWRSDAVLVRLPWTDLAAAELVEPVHIRGLRSSTPKAPSVQLHPVDEDTLKRYPRLLDAVTAGEPAAPGRPSLRFTFRLLSTADGEAVAAALDRFRPDKTS